MCIVSFNADHSQTLFEIERLSRRSGRVCYRVHALVTVVVYKIADSFW